MGSEKRNSKEVFVATSFDDVFEVAGTTGCYNIAIICACCSMSLLLPLQMLSAGFIGATPDYWCQVDELMDANWTAEQIRNLSSPSSQSCEYYNYDYIKAAALGYDAVMADPSAVALGSANDTVACDKRFFQEGYDTIVTEWDLVCENLWLSSTAVAATQVGMLFGSLSFGYVLARFGRRFGILIAVCGCIPAGLSISASVSILMYIVLKAIDSFFGMGVYVGGFVLAVEFCGQKQRSLVSSYYVLPFAFGYMATAVIAYFVRPWRYLQIALTTPAIILLLCLYIVPESPRWLCQRGRYGDAFRVVKRIASNNKRELPHDHQVLAALEHVIPQKTKQRGDCQFSCKEWIRTWVVPQVQWRTPVIFFCWFSAAMVYFGVSLGASTFGLDEYLFVLVGGVLELATYLTLWPGITFLGRRKYIVATFLIGAASLFGVMAIQLAEYDGTVPWLSICSYSGKFFVTAAFHLEYIITGEMFSTGLRSLMIGEASVCSRMGSIIAPFVNTFLSLNQSWAPAAFFGSFSLVSGFLAMLLPETKSASLDESDREKDEHRKVSRTGSECSAHEMENQDCSVSEHDDVVSRF